MADESNDTFEQIRFSYEKARHHRTFHADGVWASVTPQLELQLAFFNNLKPMPSEVTHKLTADGSLGEAKEVHGEQYVLREVNATVVINREVARSSIELLQRLLAEIDGHIIYYLCAVPCMITIMADILRTMSRVPSRELWSG